MKFIGYYSYQVPGYTVSVPAAGYTISVPTWYIPMYVPTITMYLTYSRFG